jgi:hypothetical protein
VSRAFAPPPGAPWHKNEQNGTLFRHFYQIIAFLL